MMINSITSIFSVLLWLFIFLPGLLINSQPFRDHVAAGESILFNLCLVFLTYTVTNVAMLCCIAGIAGAATRSFFPAQEDGHDLTTESAEHRKMSVIVCGGVMRGFMIYLLFLAGVYVATDSPFSTTTAEQYARMAGAISLLSFIVNYEPSKFIELMQIGKIKK